MQALLMLFGAIAIFVVAYFTYGAWLEKTWGIDDMQKTPAVSHQESGEETSEYSPASSAVLLGHHFSSIAGAGPITGPIGAAPFGWVPVYLWIVLGSTFIGGVHDFGSLVASMRHDGKGIGEIARINISPTAGILFNVFAFLTLILVVAAFTSICAGTFAYNSATPEALTGARAGTASVLFMILAVAFGFLVYRRHAPLLISSIIAVLLLVGCVFLGYYFPFIKLSQGAWNFVLCGYILIASNTPVWILLQPRDYLCSFLLYSIILFSVLGIIIGAFTGATAMDIKPFTSFNVNGSPLFPILFVTVACGAISGFHSLISAGTTSKQIAKAKDARLIGYGSMLLEGVVAVIALCAFGIVKAQGTGTTGAAKIFGEGVAVMMSTFGIPTSFGHVYTTLVYSSFALTSLDTATRIGRYITQELIGAIKTKKENPVIDFFTGKSKIGKAIGGWCATLILVILAYLLLMNGWAKIWPIFGSANQLLASLALLTITSWLMKSGKPFLMTLIPMIFMYCVTMTALVVLFIANVKAKSVILCIFAVLLFALAIVLAIVAVKHWIGQNKAKKEAAAA